MSCSLSSSLLYLLKMLAKEVIEDSLISVLTQEAPIADTDGEPISQKVLYGDIFSIQECVRLLVSWTKSCDEGSVKDKGWAIINGIASKDNTHCKICVQK